VREWLVDWRPEVRAEAWRPEEVEERPEDVLRPDEVDDERVPDVVRDVPARARSRVEGPAARADVSPFRAEP